MPLSELLVDLRDAIMQIAHHFISVDPKLSNVSLVPDYSIESHTKDHENYNIVSRSRRRRAKALLGKVILLLFLKLQSYNYLIYYIFPVKTIKYSDCVK